MDDATYDREWWDALGIDSGLIHNNDEEALTFVNVHLTRDVTLPRS